MGGGGGGGGWLRGPRGDRAITNSAFLLRGVIGEVAENLGERALLGGSLKLGLGDKMTAGCGARGEGR